jgi:hypothetical protein
MPEKPQEPIEFGSGGTTSQVDWKLLLNGEQWVAVKGEDYTSSDARFRLAANQKAREMGGTSRTKVIEEGKIAVQFFPERRHAKPRAAEEPKPARQQRRAS